jgi:hypothetical protein
MDNETSSPTKQIRFSQVDELEEETKEYVNELKAGTNNILVSFSFDNFPTLINSLLPLSLLST